MLAKIDTHSISAAALVGSGFSRLTRLWRMGQGSVLTFHGVRAEAESQGLLDASLHLPVSMFRAICAHLAKYYRIVPLSQITSAVDEGRAIPERAVAITFDDGYLSNHDLAFPVLREFGLHATIFAATGFLDGTERLWYHRLELAISRTTRTTLSIAIGKRALNLELRSMAERQTALGGLLCFLKTQPQEAITDMVDRLEEALEVPSPSTADYPDELRPMSWVQARSMAESGLVEFGGHTHRHLILGRCSRKTAEEEIHLSRSILSDRLGVAPTLFAYPNGNGGDYTPETQALLREAGFKAAVTMSPGLVQPDSDVMALPRYGAPDSVREAEATVSGAFETLKKWRQGCRRAFTF